MSWTDEFGSVFFLSIATILTGSFGLAVRYCLRSKCEHFKCCCGCFEIDRRVDLESQLEMEEHKHTEEKKSIDV
jgi:hypothetical protein